MFILCYVFFFQAEDGIRDLVRSRGLGDVYKRQVLTCEAKRGLCRMCYGRNLATMQMVDLGEAVGIICLLYTSDAADERSSVDLGGRRIIKKKKE